MIEYDPGIGFERFRDFFVKEYYRFRKQRR